MFHVKLNCNYTISEQGTDTLKHDIPISICVVHNQSHPAQLNFSPCKSAEFLGQGQRFWKKFYPCKELDCHILDIRRKKQGSRGKISFSRPRISLSTENILIINKPNHILHQPLSKLIWRTCYTLSVKNNNSTPNYKQSIKSIVKK